MSLEKNGVFVDALHDWNGKWVPNTLEYSNTLMGKKALMASHIRKECEGINSLKFTTS